MNKKLLINGGAGFIGSVVIRHIVNNTDGLLVKKVLEKSSNYSKNNYLI